MRLGRSQENEGVLEEPWVSQHHAEIVRRHVPQQSPSYVLRDFSRYGTLVQQEGDWRKIHHQEVV